MTESIKILKRNGQICDYDGNKIKLAVAKAMQESVGEIDETICDEIEQNIASMIYSEDEEIWNVEDISNEIESQLMEFKLFKIIQRCSPSWVRCLYGVYESSL